MFSLVVTIISILLVVGLAAVSVFYGGDVFTAGAAKNAAATLLTQARHVTAANSLHFGEKNQYAGNVAALVSTGFLASAPDIPAAVKHATAPAWTIFPAPAGGGAGYYTAGVTNAATPDAACTGFFAVYSPFYGSTSWSIVNLPYGGTPDWVAACRLNTGQYSSLNEHSDSSYLLWTEYQALGSGPGAFNAVYALLKTSAGDSDEACKQINQQSMGSATIGGTATHPSGLGGLGTTAYATGESSIKTVTQALTVQFGCARFGTDNVVMYKGA